MIHTKMSLATPNTINTIRSMEQPAIDRVRELEQVLAALPQVVMPVTHTLHGGIYSRTIVIPAGVVLTGGFIKVPTTLIICGKLTIYTDGDPIEIDGYKVIVASAARKQVAVIHEETTGTLVFATNAQTIEEAENEFCEDAHLLASRTHLSLNTEIITGE